MSNAERNTWGIHTQDEIYYLNNRCIAIKDSKMGDLSEINEYRDFFKKYKDNHSSASSKEVEDIATQFIRFRHSIKKDDYVAYRTNFDGMIHIGRITGEYRYNENKPLAHSYPVEWFKHVPIKYFPKSLLFELESYENSKKALFHLDKEELLDFLAGNRTFVEEKHSDWEKAKITQLLSYMSDCQQGMRDIKSQILTVLTVVSTLLSLLLGISISNDDVSLDLFTHYSTDFGFSFRINFLLDSILTLQRFYFWFTTIVFIATVSYIVYLAMESVLRFHYLQHIEERLHILIPATADDIDKKTLLTFEKFSSPIRTPFYKNRSSSASILNIFVYYAAVELGILFCFGLVIMQFLSLDLRYWFDHLTLIATIIVLVIIIALFISFYAHSDEISENAFIMGNEYLNFKKGLTNSYFGLNESNKEFKSFLQYLLFPQKISFIRLVLLCVGFLVVLPEYKLVYFYPTHLLYVIVVFDFLLFQTLYQFKDIRSLDGEKAEAGERKRLVDYVATGKLYRIRISIISVVLRLVLSTIIILFLSYSLRQVFITAYILTIFLTVVYIFAEEKKMGRFTIALSGVWFPFLFVIGAMASNISSIFSCPWNDKILILLILWLWGMTIALMNWYRKVDRLIIFNKMGENKRHQFKEHYNIIYDIIKDRRNILNESTNKDKSIFAFNRIKFDLLSICFTLLLLLLLILRLIHMHYKCWFIIPLFTIVTAGVVFFKNGYIRIVSFLICIIFLLLDAYGAWLNADGFIVVCWYNLLILSIIISVSVSKRSSKKPIRLTSMIKSIVSSIIKLLIGKTAYNSLYM